jgi:hypothetical protein
LAERLPAANLSEGLASDGFKVNATASGNSALNQHEYGLRESHSLALMFQQGEPDQLKPKDESDRMAISTLLENAANWDTADEWNLFRLSNSDRLS